MSKGGLLGMQCEDCKRVTDFKDWPKHTQPCEHCDGHEIVSCPHCAAPKFTRACLRSVIGE